MTFAHAWVLLLLLIPAGLAGLEILRQVGAIGRDARPRIPADFTPVSSRPLLSRFITAWSLWPMLLMAVAILILAGPRRSAPPTQERVLTNIEIVLDVSGSMTSPLGSPGEWAGMMGGEGEPTGPTRYTAAMEAIRQFCTSRKGDAFGLTIFGIDVIRWMPLTKDLAAIQNAAPFLNPAKMPPNMGGTRIGNALKYARGVLAQQPEGDRLIILITDGYSSDLDGNAALEVAQELASDRIVVHAVCIGSDQPPQQLSDVVVPTGGRVFGAGTKDALAGVFAHIDRMQPVRLTQGQSETVDHFRPLALAGLGLLGLHALGLLGWRWNPW